MVFGLIKNIIGTRNDREIKRIQSKIDLINDLEGEIKLLSDEELNCLLYTSDAADE